MSSPTVPDQRLATAAAQLRSVPTGQRVRLAKKTSNLFRSRGAQGASLDLTAFDHVDSVDPLARRSWVGGLTTYEDLAAATLAVGMVPLCVPQLRTITLGGAVTGLGIEAASFRNGLPHESVTAMDILIGTGEVVRATADNEYADLFHGFPNSYGSLGYALRLQIELEPVTPYVALRHLRWPDAGAATDAMTRIAADRHWQGERVDYLDGVVFGPDEVVLTLGRYTEETNQEPSDYTGQEIYYRSLQQRDTDLLTVHDYLWRWDTDWFWCSRAMGVQRPVIRRLWPDRYKRSDVYWKIINIERRHQISNRVYALRGRPLKEAVVQDVEVPAAALPEFLDFFHRDVGISPVWVCPLRKRDPSAHWPLYDFATGELYVNVGFWSAVQRTDGGDPNDGRVNRLIEDEVTRLGGRKSLYSTSYYSRAEFSHLYGGDHYRALKDKYDPRGRFPEMYDKCVGGR